MNTFIVDLKHQPGELAKVTEAIATRGIDITAFAGLTTGNSGAVALLTNDEAGTRRALDSAGLKHREMELASISLPNRPGELAKVARKLADAGISIEAAFPTGMTDGKVAIGFATDNPTRTKALLGAGEPVAVGQR